MLRIHHQRSDMLAGAQAMAPLVLAYAPFALVIGSVVATLDDPLAGWAGSWLIYGGSAHLAALNGISDGAAATAIIAGVLVNARLLVYSASMAPHWRHQPGWFRLLGPALLIDPTWALADRHAGDGMSETAERRFFLGAGLVLGTFWSMMIAFGAIAGDRLPDVGLELAAPVCLIALVGPRLRQRGHLAAAIAAATAAVVLPAGPAGTGILIAIAAGTIAAEFARRTT